MAWSGINRTCIAYFSHAEYLALGTHGPIGAMLERKCKVRSLVGPLFELDATVTGARRAGMWRVELEVFSSNGDA